MMRLYIGDSNPSLGPVPITRSDGSVVDVTQLSTLKFTLRGEYDTANLFAPATAQKLAAPVLDDLGNTFRDPNGNAVSAARYDWGSSDLATAAPGVYLGQWIGVDGNGRTQHYDAGRYLLVNGY